MAPAINKILDVAIAEGANAPPMKNEGPNGAALSFLAHALAVAIAEFKFNPQSVLGVTAEYTIAEMERRGLITRAPHATPAAPGGGPYTVN